MGFPSVSVRVARIRAVSESLAYIFSEPEVITREPMDAAAGSTVRFAVPLIVPLTEAFNISVPCMGPAV